MRFGLILNPFGKNYKQNLNRKNYKQNFGKKLPTFIEQFKKDNRRYPCSGQNYNFSHGTVTSVITVKVAIFVLAPPPIPRH